MKQNKTNENVIYSMRKNLRMNLNPEWCLSLSLKSSWILTWKLCSKDYGRRNQTSRYRNWRPILHLKLSWSSWKSSPWSQRKMRSHLLPKLMNKESVRLIWLKRLTLMGTMKILKTMRMVISLLRMLWWQMIVLE